MVANCLSALQEIYTAEANISSETAARDREHLFSKAVIYSLLNRLFPLDMNQLLSQCPLYPIVSLVSFAANAPPVSRLLFFGCF